MIGLIRGILLEKHPPFLLVDVNGIGYELSAPMSTFYQLPDVGLEISLHTHFVVREDAQQLYGFYTKSERALFRTLLKVNGVGPKLGLTILSSIEPDEFVRSVLNQDAASLVSVPGIGKKTAERLIVEMRDRLADWHETPTLVALPLQKSVGRNQTIQDAISALIALGYKPQEASRVVAKVDAEDLSSEEIIRRSLKEMMA